MADRSFQQKVKELRVELLERSVGVLIDAGAAAARELKRLCQSGTNEFARLAAARSILELGGLTKRTIEDEQTMSRIEVLEQLLRRK